MATVSVIIPVFNAEKYISTCIESLISQSYSDFEIICVDDGSTDNSPRILQQYMFIDPRIKIIEQKQLMPVTQGIRGWKWHQENTACSLISMISLKRT